MEILTDTALAKVMRVQDSENRELLLIKAPAGENNAENALAAEFDKLKQINQRGCRHFAIAKHYHQTTGENYIEMANVAGDTLRRFMQRKSFNEATLLDKLEIAVDLAEAVEHLHWMGFLHNSLLPEHILVDETKRKVSLLDLSLAVPIADKGLNYSGIAVPMVLERYISPERTGKTRYWVDARSDLYSLGLILYELFSGKYPFQATDAVVIRHNHLTVTPPALSSLLAGFPLAVAEIVAKLMEKDPLARYESAGSLKYDLMGCSEALRKNEPMPAMSLGQQHFFGHALLQNKLYGRASELQLLKRYFESLTPEDGGLLLVSGFSGIGKTAFVEHFFAQQNKQAELIKGKFELSKTSLPYFAFKQMFSALLHKLAAAEKTELPEVMRAICLRDGAQAAALLPIMPELQPYLAEVPSRGSDDPQNAEAKLFHAAEDFLRSSVKSCGRLVLFLDDLQWSDNSSVQLLAYLVNANIAGVYLICSYRDNEIAEQPALRNRIEGWHEQRQTESIHLAGLGKADLMAVVADALNTDQAEVAELAGVILDKTNGNIFFVKQFMTFLVKQKLFRRTLSTKDCATLRWEWDLPEIRRQCPSENMVDLILQSVNELGDEAIPVLVHAALLGNAFKLDTLSLSLGLGEAELQRLLFRLQTAGMIELQQTRGVFAHDRIYQAVYGLLPGQQAKEHHLRIGKLLLARQQEQDVEDLFDVFYHWSRAADVLATAAERESFLQLCYKVGQTAKENASYAEAMAFLEQGRQYMQEDLWQTDPAFMLSYMTELAEVCFLNGDHETARALCESCAVQAQTIGERFRPYFIKSKTCMAQSRLQESVGVGCEFLDYIGLGINRQPDLAYIGSSIEKLLQDLGSNPVDKIRNLGDMVEEKPLFAMKMLAHITTPAYMQSRLLFVEIILHMCALSIKYGNNKDSAHAWSGLALVLVNFRYPVALGNALGEEAVRLQRRSGDANIRTAFVYHVFIEHRMKPLRGIAAALLEGYEPGRRIGDTEYCCQYLLQHVVFALFSGRNLPELLAESVRLLQILQKYQQKPVMQRLLITMQLMQCLNQADKWNGSLRGEYFDEVESVPYFIEVRDMAGLYIWATQKLMLSFIMRDFDACEAALQLVEKHQAATAGQIYELSCAFYGIMTGLAKIETGAAGRGETVLRQMEPTLQKLALWAGNGPNYVAKEKLVQAEVCRVCGETQQAVQLYDQAIVTASNDHFVHEAAIGCELMSRLSRELGNVMAEKLYGEKAMDLYTQWGAAAKVEQLGSQHGRLSVHGAAASQSVNSCRVDLQAVLNSTAALSETIELEALIKKMLSIILVHSGATKALFVEHDPDRAAHLSVCFIERDGYAERYVQLSWPEAVREGLPASVIERAIATRTRLLVERPEEDRLFCLDEYIVKNKPKVVLVIPLYRNEKLTGLIYLENKLFAGAFSPEHVEVLTMLSAQIAISLENSRLYFSLEEKVQQRTVDLNKALKKVEKLATTDKLTSIYNRLKIDELIERELQQVERYGGTMSIVLADIDHFKLVNDNYGHLAGDKVLRKLALLIKKMLRKTDFVARWGGEEFILLLTGTNLEQAYLVAEKIRLSIYRHEDFAAAEISLSLGVAEFRKQDSKETLVDRADQALYRAKNQGRNQTQCQRG